jgi:flagellar assembly protein FliH
MFEKRVQAIRIMDAKPGHRSFQEARVTASAPVTEHSNVAWEDGFRAGLAEGDKERQALQSLLAAASALQPEPSDEIAVLIAETVMRLVTTIVGSTPIDRKVIQDRARQAASLICDADAARTMWVHPDDLPLLVGCEFALAIRPDPICERGSIRIDCSPGWIEHGNALYLDDLRAELGIPDTCS